jgi:type IV pilus assembly protein PilE
MRRNSGMTLIELMMVLAVMAILIAIALPSYQRYQVRGIRSQGQQFLMDLAQSQEQFFLDQRQYATDLGLVQAPGILVRSIPAEISAQYTLTRPFNVNNAATPPTFMLVLTPNPGSTPANQNDGALVINSLQQRWREVDGNLVYNVQVAGVGDCTWEAGNCVAR